jgi:peptidyl-prolyl cis-trans isomerase C
MKLHKTLLSVVSAAILAGCSQPVEPVVEENWLGEAAIGTINGIAVPESLFRRLSLDTIQKTAEDMTPEERSAMVDRLVTFQLASSDGESRGLHQERSIAASLELARIQVLANAAVERHLEENPPSEAELRDLYEDQIANLSGTEYKARHILVETENEASDLIGQLEGGADFASLAQEFSTGPTGPDGGDLGWFAAERMVAPFSNAVQALEVGAYSSEPVQTQFGWHVILLEDTRDQQPPGIESMRVELTTIAQQQRVQSYLEGLRNAAEVAVE